jgi:hypothetical protein
MVVAVMQPTYLPWLGYFDLMDQSDVFVFLDTVQFEKRSWQQRNRIKTAQGELYLTVPVLGSCHQTIAEVEINNNADWRRKHWATLEMSYRKSPCWSHYGSVLQRIYEREWGRLADLNIEVVTQLAGALGIRAKLERTSQMPPLPGRKAEPLVALCRQFQADTYLSPLGSRAYLDSEAPFAEQGIALRFQSYEHPIYPQRYSTFIPFLSVVDLLMNVGEGSLELLRSGRRPATALSETPLPVAADTSA